LFSQSQTPQLLLPDGNGAWLIQVVTRGGILGTVQGDISVTSEGKFLCTKPDQGCPGNLKVPELQTLVEMIQPGRLQIFPVSLCSDCITSTIVISRRDAMGSVHTYTATWDITTKSRLPADVMRIYDALAAVMK
jgi:hypothetical protein